MTHDSQFSAAGRTGHEARGQLRALVTATSKREVAARTGYSVRSVSRWAEGLPLPTHAEKAIGLLADEMGAKPCPSCNGTGLL